MREEWTWVHDQTHAHHIRPRDNGDCIAHTQSLPRAEQIVQEHNAVVFAVEHGEYWTLEDWRRWRQYHAMPQPLVNEREKEKER